MIFVYILFSLVVVCILCCVVGAFLFEYRKNKYFNSLSDNDKKVVALYLQSGKLFSDNKDNNFPSKGGEKKD